MTGVLPGVGAECFAVTVADLVAERIAASPDAVAVEEDGRTWTYRQLDDRVARIAGALSARGVGRGDRVAVLSENRHEYLELELAVGRLGAITVPELAAGGGGAQAQVWSGWANCRN